MKKLIRFCRSAKPCSCPCRGLSLDPSQYFPAASPSDDRSTDNFGTASVSKRSPRLGVPGGPWMKNHEVLVEAGKMR